MFSIASKIINQERQLQINSIINYNPMKVHNYNNMQSKISLGLRDKISLNMQYFEKGHLSFRQSKNFFLFFMGDESPSAHESKSMIRFVPSAQQLTLQSSKVQNCQN